MSVLSIDSMKVKRWHIESEPRVKVLHRADGPAIEYPDGTKKWFCHGVLHRMEGPAAEYNNGERAWYRNGVPHRVDGPALEGHESRVWYQDGKFHRTDGPAIEYPDGTKWFQYDLLHRVDGPAIDCTDDKQWFFHGQLHRVGGPAVDITKFGMRWIRWYQYGTLHREDGPAVIERTILGTNRWCRKWYYHGMLHRIDGPAVEDGDNGFTAWFFEGYRVTQEQLERIGARIHRRVSRTRAFILDKMLPKIYDPSSTSGQRRMMESYSEIGN